MSAQDAFRWDETLSRSQGQADTRELPAKGLTEGEAWALGAAGAAFLILLFIVRLKGWELPSIKFTFLKKITRQNSVAPLIAGGLLMMAFDHFLAGNLIPYRSFLMTIHRDGWIAFCGAALALGGLYCWLKGKPPGKI